MIYKLKMKRIFLTGVLGMLISPDTYAPGEILISIGGGQPNEKIKTSSNVLKAVITIL